MNPAEYLQKVAELLDSKRPAAPGMYLLYVKDKEVRLGKLYDCREEPDKIRALYSKDINEGLRSRAWDRVQDRIAALRKQGVL